MTSSSSSTISPASLGVQAGGAAAQTTTKRALILKEIQTLQKQEAGLYKQMQALAGKSDPASIQERIELQQQIDAIESEIKALQSEMLQKSADEKVQVRSDKNTAGTASADVASAAAAAIGGDSGAAPAAAGVLSTVGSVINTQA